MDIRVDISRMFAESKVKVWGLHEMKGVNRIELIVRMRIK